MSDSRTIQAGFDSSDVVLLKFILKHPRENFLAQNEEIWWQRIALMQSSARFKLLKFSFVNKNFKWYRRHTSHDPICEFLIKTELEQNCSKEFPQREILICGAIWGNQLQVKRFWLCSIYKLYRYRWSLYSLFSYTYQKLLIILLIKSLHSAMGNLKQLIVYNWHGLCDGLNKYFSTLFWLLI